MSPSEIRCGHGTKCVITVLAPLLLAGVGPRIMAADRFRPRTPVSIRGDRWFLNDKVTYRGAPAEGLLTNVRMVDTVFEDTNRPDFDPDANTDAFIARIPDSVAQGVRAFTLCLQGGFPGYKGAVNSGFPPGGSLRDSYPHRVRLDWCVKPRRETNPAPRAVLNGTMGKEILYMAARPGQAVSLDAGLSRDPDDDRLTYEGFVCRESGTYESEVTLTNASSALVFPHVPSDAAGKTVRVVLTARDNETPPLAAYRRVVAQACSESAVRSGPARASKETPSGITTNEYFPVPESQGGWRKLDKPQGIRNVAGMDPGKLDDLKKWLLQSDKRNFAAVVIRRGHIVLEVERGNSAKTDSRRVASVSKAVCATVLAIASERSQHGLTPRKMRFDDPAFDFIPWAQPLSDPRKAQITVKQLLNHTSGLCPEATGAANDGTWEYILGHTGDPRTAKLAFDPGTACGYSTHALHHASLVCETVTGKPYDQFTVEALFKPLGIERWWFQYFDGGKEIGRHPTHGLGMPARDLARIAYCMLHDGRWGDRQVIPKWFVDQTAAPTHKVHSPEMRWKLNPQIFSHGWELPARHWPESGRSGQGIPSDARYKPGSGGQLVAFVPSLDLVITRQTGSSGAWAYEEYLRRACATVVSDSQGGEK